MEGKSQRTSGGGDHHGDLVVRRMSEITPRKVAWLWPGRVPAGKLVLWSGDPGLGKSFASLDLAARVSSGQPYPDDSTGTFTTGSVVILSAEDDPADTIRPRLEAAGADLERIVCIEGIRRSEIGGAYQDLPSLQRDVERLSAAVGEMGDCRLVIIDPISSYLGDKVNPNQSADVRRVLAPLAKAAQDTDSAVILVDHHNKNSTNRAMYRSMGSIAFVAACRVAVAFVRDKEDSDRRLILPVKNNLAADTGGLAYKLRGEPGEVPRVAWEAGPVGITADEAMQPDDSRGGRAKRWLAGLLADGPVGSIEVEAAADDQQIPKRQLDRAKVQLGIKPYKQGFQGPWIWELPTQ